MTMIRFASTGRLMFVCTAAAVLCGSQPSWGSSFTVEPATAAVGGSVDLCVRMDGSGGKTVAGMQMDLAWDVNCLTVNIASGNAADCRAERATGKNVHNRVHDSGNAMTAMMLSVSDTKPIPDGRLFCCGFTVSDSPPDNVCTIDMGNVVASDSRGTSLQGVTARGGVVQISGVRSGGQAPAAAPLPGGPAVFVPAEGAAAPGAPIAPAAPAAPGAPVAPAAPGAPAAQAPAAPGKAAAQGAAPGGAVPVGAAPAGQPGAPGGEAGQIAPEAVPAMTAAGTPATPPRTPAAVSTPIATRSTPQPTTPRAQFTATAPAPTAAAVGSATAAAATTPTVKARKHKAKKRRSHAD